MKIEISMTEEDIKQWVLSQLSSMLNTPVAMKDVQFLVMTPANYESALWENGRFKVEVHMDNSFLP